MSKQYFDVPMPSMGEGVHEATVVRWLKEIGGRIEKDEPLIEVSTDKVDTEIVSPFGGFLIAQFVKSDDVIQVDQVVAQIGESADTPVVKPTATQKASESREIEKMPPAARSRSTATPRGSAAQGQRPPQSFHGTVRSSPLVRKLARERGVDLTEVPGTGLYGRITSEDLEEFLRTGGTRVARYADRGMDDQALETRVNDGVETLDGVLVRREKMSKMRRLTADHMVRSVRTSPHVTTTFEIDLQAVVRHKETVASNWTREEGVRLSLTAYFIWAAVEALKEFPDVNAVVDGDEILYRDDVNLGCAVATEAGLIVPVIKRAQTMDLQRVGIALNEIVAKAREKKLAPEDVKGGTFSLTNPGIFGSLHSQPIINQPQSAILSVGAIVKRPTVVGDSIEIRPTCQVGLTFDHRLIDGEGGAKFLGHLRNSLESL